MLLKQTPNVNRQVRPPLPGPARPAVSPGLRLSVITAHWLFAAIMGFVAGGFVGLLATFWMGCD